jgi:tungstate transport system substrate-binding protein
MGLKRSTALAVCVISLFARIYPLAANGSSAGSDNEIRNTSNGRIILATTTSTDNSGLLAAILPEFTNQTGIAVDVIAVGTGKALALGEHGDADVVLVHAPEKEIAFVEAGFGVNRRGVMHNDFVLVGPPGDPARISGTRVTASALRILAGGKYPFVSRGDDSGTHSKEIALWDSTGITPEGEWYREAGQGMGAVLTIASEIRGYTLVDRGTWLAMKDKLKLELVMEGDSILFNPYGVIAVNPDLHSHIRYIDSMKFIGWLTSLEGQQLIGDFRINGEPLFIPNAVPLDHSGTQAKGVLGRAFDLIFSGDREILGITFRSLSLALTSTFLSGIFGISAALLLRLKDFPGRKAVLVIINGLMALPTVIIGLTIYAMLSRSGPFGSLGLLYTQPAIVIGQTVLAFPIITSLVYGALSTGDDILLETLDTMGIFGFRRVFIVLNEARYAVLMALVAGFGRVIGEVGVSMMLGGNIRWHTRTITTTIALESGKGEFEQALALGVVLIVLSLGVNMILGLGDRK